MGMYSWIEHPKDTFYQFKTGWDWLKCYKVGDTFDWAPDPRFPSDQVDGVYPACGEDGEDVLWVVIRGQKIVAVTPIKAGDTPDAVAKYYDIPGQNTPESEQTMSHTPGPWSLELDGEDGNMEVHDCYGCTAVVNGDVINPEHLANAKLIRAAPELLAALKACLTPFGALAVHDFEHAAQRLADINQIAILAIAEVEGKA